MYIINIFCVDLFFIMCYGWFMVYCRKWFIVFFFIFYSFVLWVVRDYYRKINIFKKIDIIFYQCLNRTNRKRSSLKQTRSLLQKNSHLKFLSQITAGFTRALLQTVKVNASNTKMNSHRNLIQINKTNKHSLHISFIWTAFKKKTYDWLHLRCCQI